MNEEFNGKIEDKANNSYNNKILDIDNINIILNSILTTSAFLNLENIKDIKFLQSKQGYTIEVSNNNRKLYMEISEFGYVEIVRENSINGKIVYLPDDDYNVNKENIIPVNKNIYTLDQMPWIEYIEIDEETHERKLRTDTPEEIVRKYNEFVNNVKNNDNELNNNNVNSPISKIKIFFNSDLKKDVTKFAIENGYKGAKYIGKWKEYKVYEPYMDRNDVSYTGLPLVILVNDKNEIRMSTSDEAMAIINNGTFMASFEENENIEASGLKRELLLKIKDDFVNERNKYVNLSIPNDFYLNYLEKIETILNNYNFENDDRFVAKNISNIHWLNNDDAINYLFDILMGNIIIQPNEISSEQNIVDVSIKQKEYYKDEFVCKQEKEMLLNIIQEIKKYIYSFNSKQDSKEFNDISIPKLDNISPKQIDDLIRDIDNKIDELETEKDNIETEISKNLEEVSKYSILNKTIEELQTSKNKFINDWNILLFNTTSELWIINSATYRVHIKSIIDAILRTNQDSKTIKELELLDKFPDCLKNKDRDLAINLVNQLKEIESENN